MVIAGVLIEFAQQNILANFKISKRDDAKEYPQGLTPSPLPTSGPMQFLLHL